jgi:hypothetical protein
VLWAAIRTPFVDFNNAYEAVNRSRTNRQLSRIVTAVTATVKEQATQIQKVSAQVEASKPASRVVNNN